MRGCAAGLGEDKHRSEDAFDVRRPERAKGMLHSLSSTSLEAVLSRTDLFFSSIWVNFMPTVPLYAV